MNAIVQLLSVNLLFVILLSRHLIQYLLSIGNLIESVHVGVRGVCVCLIVTIFN